MIRGRRPAGCTNSKSAPGSSFCRRCHQTPLQEQQLQQHQLQQLDLQQLQHQQHYQLAATAVPAAAPASSSSSSSCNSPDRRPCEPCLISNGTIEGTQVPPLGDTSGNTLCEHKCPPWSSSSGRPAWKCPMRARAVEGVASVNTNVNAALARSVEGSRSVSTSEYAACARTVEGARSGSANKRQRSQCKDCGGVNRGSQIWERKQTPTQSVQGLWREWHLPA
jgi:hypothetical protein